LNLAWREKHLLADLDVLSIEPLISKNSSTFTVSALHHLQIQPAGITPSRRTDQQSHPNRADLGSLSPSAAAAVAPL
jgi:hypothetical protein